MVTLLILQAISGLLRRNSRLDRVISNLPGRDRTPKRASVWSGHRPIGGRWVFLIRGTVGG
jgi:hypothetical protein